MHSPATQVTLPTLEFGSTSPGENLPAVPGYEVLAVLGHGGMSVVYKANHVRLDRLVALKMISAGRHAGAQELARFRAEAEAVARLQHPVAGTMPIATAWCMGPASGRASSKTSGIDICCWSWPGVQSACGIEVPHLTNRCG